MENKELQIKAKDEDLKGVYTNAMVVSHTKEEFCLDFLLMNFNPPLLVARIITSPAYLKRIINALSENLKKYEEKFGQVEPSKETEVHLGFKPQ
jgi:hypothetical protein